MYGAICMRCGYLLDDDLKCGECNMTQDKYDPVNKPMHYNHSDGVECIDYIEQVLGLDGFIAYCKGNAMKYSHRANYKGNPLEDSKKAQWYINRMISAMERKYK